MTATKYYWLPIEIKMIKMVKENPIIYKKYRTKTPKHKDNVNIAWDNISLVMNIPSRTCKQMWNSILFQYAKLKIMAETGQVPIETLMFHNTTNKFFNGILTFMDPYLSKITSARIPFSIHKQYNDLFMDIMTAQNKNKVHNIQEKEIKKKHPIIRHDEQNFQEKEINEIIKVNRHDVTHFQEKFTNIIINDNLNASDKHHLFNSITGAVKHAIQDLMRNPNNIIMTNIVPNNSSSFNKTAIDRVQLGLESELIIDDDENNMKTEKISADYNYDNNIDYYDNEKNAMPINHVDDNIEINGKEYTSPVNNDTNMNVNNDIITPVTNETTGVSDNDLRKFFNELGVVMCAELSIVNQKNLQRQINDLVKNILTEE